MGKGKREREREKTCLFFEKQQANGNGIANDGPKTQITTQGQSRNIPSGAVS